LRNPSISAAPETDRAAVSRRGGLLTGDMNPDQRRAVGVVEVAPDGVASLFSA
jgi:hypothetical protein